jgi:hypothetical protein
MRVFIVRLFGTRIDTDFDAIAKKLVGPAINNIGAEGSATGEILEAGTIRIDMFQEPLISDLESSPT